MIFLQGVLIGLFIAMPVGPVDFLCIRNSLTWGILYGLMVGLGVAAADAMYGMLVGYGLSEIFIWIQQHEKYLQLAGGLFLCGMGVANLLITVKEPKEKITPPSFASQFSAGFTIIALAPTTLLSFVGLFTAVGIELRHDQPVDLAAVVLGIFTGSMIWWVILCCGSGYFKGRFGLQHLRWLGRLVGCLFIFLGILAMTSSTSS